MCTVLTGTMDIWMEPFDASLVLQKVDVFSPEHEEVVRSLSDCSRSEREVFARLWLTEGVPSAFSGCPLIYESIRSWLAARSNVHPKEINITGSARLGFSLASGKYPKKFDSKSDLDFNIVSEKLFEVLQDEFSRFREFYRESKIHPRNEREKSFWNDNTSNLPRNLALGFIDINKLPNIDACPMAKNINNSMWMLVEKLKKTENSPVVKGASVRVYRNWNCLSDRLTLNLKINIEKISCRAVITQPPPSGQ